MNIYLNRILTKVRLSKQIFYKGTPCWERGITPYNSIKIMKTSLSVHRFMFRCFRGDLLSDMEIDHLCNNKMCCNPWHLEQVSNSVNIKRGLNK